MENNSGTLRFSPSLTFTRYAFIYASVCLLFGLIAAYVLFKSPLPEPPVLGDVPGRAIRLGAFQIPHYSKNEQLMFIITGKSSIVAPDKAFNVIEPNIIYMKNGATGDERVRFEAASGHLLPNASDATLRGGVVISGMIKQGEIWKERWRISGETLTIDSKAGRFMLSDSVSFLSPECRIEGTNLAGNIDVEGASLLSYSFDRIQDCVFIPDLLRAE